MKLSNDELVGIIESFESVDYYETIEVLLNYIEFNGLTENIAGDLIFILIIQLTTPATKKQQNSQFEIIKKLIKYPIVKNYLKDNFYKVIVSLNVNLVAFVIKELNIDINVLFGGYTALQLVVFYLNNNPNENDEFVYEMFDYLLAIGVDINKLDWRRFDVDYYIKRIKDQNIMKKLDEMITNHIKSKY